MNNKKNTLLILLLIVTCFTLISCGSKKINVEDVYESSSRIDTSHDWDDNPEKPIAFCNGIGELSGDPSFFKGKMTSTGYNNMIRLKITSLSENLKGDTSYKLLFYVWKASSENQIQGTRVPLQYYVEIGSGYNVIRTGYYSDYNEEKGEYQGKPINGQLISEIAAQYNLSGDSISDFLNQMTFIVDVKDLTYDVLQVVSFKEGSWDATYKSIDALIPNFYAEMDDYQYEPDGVTQRSEVILSKHPFYEGSGWTSLDHAAYFQEFCF